MSNDAELPRLFVEGLRKMAQGMIAKAREQLVEEYMADIKKDVEAAVDHQVHLLTQGISTYRDLESFKTVFEIKHIWGEEGAKNED